MLEGTVISRSDNLMETHFNDELIALHMGTSKFHMFNMVAQRIWEIVEVPTTMQALCDRLCDEFEVDMATCKQDVGELIDYLVVENVVVLANV